MNELQQLIAWMKAEKAKDTARVIQFEAYQDWVNARPGRERLKAFAEIIDKAELLLKNTGASTESAHFANTMLGECAASNESSNNEPLAGALGETRAVGQNEQTKELYANPHVCPCCGWQCTCEDQPCSCCSA